MTARPLLILAPLAVLIAVGASWAQDGAVLDTPDDARRALAEAQGQEQAARSRAERLEGNAASAAAVADRTAREEAALAARIQESEAQVAANEARIGLIGQQQQALGAELARRQQPLVELTAALQRLSRRPAALSLLRPGSLREAVYLRAGLETMLPEVGRRTAGLRSQIDRGRALQGQARQASMALRAGQGELARRRQELAMLETRQRLASREATGIADRESERATALAEQARDLTALVGELGQDAQLRAALAALPGPVPRPAQPQGATVSAVPLLAPAPTGVPQHYLLPVAGRLVAGFGAAAAGRSQSRGIAIATRGAAQVVAPGAGRVAFAGPYQGYGLIVIIDHGGGWVSLVTGLAQLDVKVGRDLVPGSPLGQAGPGRPVLTLELRHQGQPVNPLDFLRG